MRTDHLQLLLVGDFLKSSLKDIAACLFCRFLNLYISPSRHTLSKALNMSRNTPLTSKPLSKEAEISWVIDRGRFMQESPGLNSDCFGEIRLLSVTCCTIWYVWKSCRRLEEERLNDSFWYFVCHLFEI